MSEATYKRYPMTMTHPGFKPAVVSKSAVDGSHGQPSRFPPVVVNDETNEEYHASQGYVPAGKTDPAAWVSQHAAPQPEGFERQEYPKWVGDTLVGSAEEEARLTGETVTARAEGLPGIDEAFASAARAVLEDDEKARMAARIAELEAQLAAKPAPRKGGRPRKQVA